MMKSLVVSFFLLDLSSAFETIEDHYLCLFLKELLGVDGRLLEWFTSYLSSRTQRVTIDSIKSAHSSPPRISVGSNIILHLHPSHWKDYLKHGFTFHIYTDNTQVYIGFKPKDAVSVLKRLEESVEEIRVWMCHHKLKLNNDKTELMIISTKNKVKKIGDMAFTLEQLKYLLSQLETWGS